MHFAILIIKLASIGYAQAGESELTAKNATNAQGSTNTLVEKLVDKLLNRALEVWSLHHTDLENTTLEKGGFKVAGPPSIQAPRAAPRPQMAFMRTPPSARDTGIMSAQLSHAAHAQLSHRYHGVVSTRSSSSNLEAFKDFVNNLPSTEESRVKEAEEAKVLAPVLVRPIRPPPPPLKLLPTENLADDPSLANPLLRQTRLSTAWFGAIIEVDGVLLTEKDDLQQEAWRKTAAELDNPTPMQFELDKAAHLRNEVAVSEIFHWAQRKEEIKHISDKKEAIFQKLVGDKPDRMQPGVQKFLQLLMEYGVPVAAVTTRPRHDVEAALVDLGLRDFIEHIVAAEDFYDKLDCYNYAAQLIHRPHMRCVVLGTSNRQIEAAHDSGMQCVAVPSHDRPNYEFSAADLVSRDLSTLGFVNLKNLFAKEQTNEPQLQLQLEAEAEAEARLW